MKIIAIVRDSAGAFHCAHVKNPDLLRREIASQTGSASLVYASAIVVGSKAEALLDTLRHKILPHYADAPSLQHDIGFLAAVSWMVVGRPLLQAQAQRMWRRARKAVGILACQRFLHGLKAQDSRGVDHG